MNLLIADSGSTKTDWRFIDSNRKIIAFRSEGYNPYLISGTQMEESLRREVLVPLGSNTPTMLFFYGAGCGTDANKYAVKNRLRQFFLLPQLKLIRIYWLRRDRFVVLKKALLPF